MNKAIFLDRDGVLNIENDHYYVYRAEDVTLNTGVIETLQKFQEMGFLLIVITNQGAIAMGLCTHRDVETVHGILMKEFTENGIRIEEIYYCPHHDSVEKCLCRKPGSLLIEKALARFGIDPDRSYFIGDHERDMAAARKAGITPIKVERDQDLRLVLKEFYG